MIVKLDFEDVKQFEERLRVISKDLQNRFFREAVNRIGGETLRESSLRTPAVTGHLRRSWGITKAEKSGDTWHIEVINPVKYALYVEEGHRQKVGRYVPAIGKRLVQPFVEGKHMLRDSLKEKIAPQTQEYLEGKLKEMFGV